MLKRNYFSWQKNALRHCKAKVTAASSLRSDPGADARHDPVYHSEAEGDGSAGQHLSWLHHGRGHDEPASGVDVSDSEQTLTQDADWSRVRGKQGLLKPELPDYLFFFLCNATEDKVWKEEAG